MENSVTFLEILGTETSIDTAGRSFAAYVLSLSRNGKTESVTRRYRQFQELDSRLRAIPQNQRPQRKDLPKLTGKRWGSGLKEEVVDKRKRKLAEYLHELLSIAGAYPAVATLVFGFLARSQPSSRQDEGQSESDESGGDDAKSVVSVRPGPMRRLVAQFPSTWKMPPPPPKLASSASASPLAAHPAASERRPSRLSMQDQSLKTVNDTTSPGKGSAGDPLCQTCGRNIASTLVSSTAAPRTWDATRFCTLQCEKFFSAAATKGFAIVQDGGKNLLSGVSSTPVASAATPDNREGTESPHARRDSRSASGSAGQGGWWGTGRRGSMSHGSSTHVFASALNLFGSSRDTTSDLARQTSFIGSDLIGLGASARQSPDEELVDGRPDGAPETDSKVAGRGSETNAFLQRARHSEKTGILSKFRSSIHIRRRTLQEEGVSAPAAASIANHVGVADSTQARYAGVLSAAGVSARIMSPGSAPSMSVSEVVHLTGLMFKRGGFHGSGLKTWKKRYFELRGNSLYYFRTSSPTLLGVLQLMKTPSHQDLVAISSAATRAGVDVSSRNFVETLLTSNGFFYARVSEISPIACEHLGLPGGLTKKDKLPGAIARAAGITHTGPYVLLVATPERNLFLACETADAYVTWHAAINKIVTNEQQRIVAMLSAMTPKISTTAELKLSLPGDNASEAELDSAGLTSDLSSNPMSITSFQDVLAVDRHVDVDTIVSSNHISTESSPSETPRANGSASLAAVAAHSSNAHVWEISAKDLEIVEAIGSGAFGEVYRGRMWGTDVAVKLLPQGSVTDEALESLKAEVTILSQLRHPNVVLYLGACTTPPDIFVVTEWCERGSLQSSLYDHSVPMSVANRLGMAIQTAQGMCYLHSPERKIIHRDLKSHNLLVTRDFSIKVADFGLTIMRSASGASQVVDSSLKQSKPGDIGSDKSRQSESVLKLSKGAIGEGVFSNRLKQESLAPVHEEEGQAYGVHGTPQWMAPEVLEGQRYNGSVDVYSFGVVLCELFSRILPFSDTYKRFEFVDAVLEEGAMPTIPRWCDALSSEPATWCTELDDTSLISTEGAPWGWSEDVDSISITAASLNVSCAPLIGSLLQSDVPVTASGKTLGGVEEWSIQSGDCTGVLRLVIETCLNRDPGARASFEELVDLLRAVIDRPPADLFMQLEVPRLREALAYGDETDAGVSANEIVQLASYALFCNISSLPGSGISRARGVLGPNESSSLHGTGEDSVSPTIASARGLVVKLQPSSTTFCPLLPFAAAPCVNMGHMFSIPYVDLQTVTEAAPQLFAGLAARLRAIDLLVRSKHSLPLYCPDLRCAVAAGPKIAEVRVIRQFDFGTKSRIGVCVTGFELPPITAQVEAAGVEAGGAPPLSSKKVGASAAKAAARAAAAKEQAESLKFKTAIAAASHVIHALWVLLQVFDVTTPSLTSLISDNGDEVHIADSAAIKLPPLGSTDRMLLCVSSRLVYSLATVVAAAALSSPELSFVTRPPAGMVLDWRLRVRVIHSFPSLPEYGSDALCGAAFMLRALWTRLPILRTCIAHIVAVTSLSLAGMMGGFSIEIVGAPSGNAADALQTISVNEDVVMGRFIGIILARLAWNGSNDQKNGRSSTSSLLHPLVSAVESRMRVAQVRRVDGIVLGSIETEEFDPTLC
jgi:serine/threonine protein kinase